MKKEKNVYNRKSSRDHFLKVYNERKHNGHGWISEMAEELEVSVSAVSKRIKDYKQKGAIPLDSGNSVGTGELLRGTSTLYDDDGKVKLQWVKTDALKQDILDAFKRSVEDITKKINPVDATPAPMYTNEDILVKYPLGDPHFGLLTWHKEVGEDFDLKIAKQSSLSAMQNLVDSAPNANECLILDLGDTLHTDDQTNKTKASGHQLDVDGRFDKLFDMALHILTSMINIALKKHNIVRFRKTRGNHDPDASIAIGAFIEAYYRNDPRVIVERSPSIFWSYKFGKTLHFSTHGHTTKQKDLPEIIAHDCKDVWSDCNFVYADTGHIHHQSVIETRSCICESHNSLAAGDSYNYGHGYRSRRNMKAITYHKEYGEIQRATVDIRMIKDLDE